MQINSSSGRLQQIINNNWQILFLLGLGFIIAIVTLQQFGESWDELQFFKYADRALAAYTTWPRTGTMTLTGNTYDNYGPFYIMLVTIAARVLSFFIPWITSDLRHLIYFLTYLMGSWAFYALCERWLTRSAAIGATLLLMTQPVFWGHAFISPKDIPFLAFFLLSLLLGFRMVDSRPLKYESATRPTNRMLMAFAVFWLLSILGLFAATPLIHSWIDNLVRTAASGKTNIISIFASDIHNVSPEIYIQKYFVAFLWSRSAFVIVMSAVLLLLVQRFAPATLESFIRIFPAAIFLGFTTSIRIFGPFAGLIVIGYALMRDGRKALPTLTAYAVIAIIAMYLTWPYLWLDPVGHFIESARVMAEYPWKGQVLFEGVMYASTDIPRSYLPVLLGIQLTEPVWFLFAGGMALTTYGAIKQHPASRLIFALTIVWFIIPLLIFIIGRSPLYDNFRQIFFILPPVFLMAGVVFDRIRQPILRSLLIALLVLPGVVDGARLHPYEYIYYNRFIGGVQGAFRNFELDYWGTSYREAANYLAITAPSNASVWVDGPAHLLQLYSRPDLKIYSTYETKRADHYDFVVTLTRYNLDLFLFPNARILHVIERDGSLLTVIKKP